MYRAIINARDNIDRRNGQTDARIPTGHAGRQACGGACAARPSQLRKHVRRDRERESDTSRIDPRRIAHDRRRSERRASVVEENGWGDPPGRNGDVFIAIARFMSPRDGLTSTLASRAYVDFTAITVADRALISANRATRPSSRRAAFGNTRLR